MLRYLFFILCVINYTQLPAINAGNGVQQHVYMVMLNKPPVAHVFDESLQRSATGQLSAEDYASHLTATHDALLRSTFASGTYQKLYSYNHLVNGFAALLSEEQANTLSNLDEVLMVERDHGVEKFTTYTPSYLGLPGGAWQQEGGAINAGEGIVIGLVDTGIDPTHPSFTDQTLKPYANTTHYKGLCNVATNFPQGSCNKKLVGAQYFAEAAIASGALNTSNDFASPIDADGHGTHTASTAAGNNGVAVIVDGLNFGFASGMSPRSQIAVYKALYEGIGGFVSDVVAAIEQAVKDKVDILSLSIGPSSPPSGIATYFGFFEVAMLSAVKAGVFVVQAAGNSGPSPLSIRSFSPWICSVAAGITDRTYPNTMILGNNATIHGIGLAPGTPPEGMYEMILAKDAAQSVDHDPSDCQDPSLFNKETIQGKVLICSYGINLFFGEFQYSKVVETAKNVSAAGVILVITSELGSSSVPNALFPIPAIIVTTLNDSEAVLQYYQSASNTSAKVKILGGDRAQFSNGVMRVAGYSSRGPDVANANLQVAEVLKPNIMAPGSMIWAAWSQNGTGEADYQGQRFAMISGTSMATPHIAGIAALVKHKNPTFSPAAISSALTTTAFTVDSHGRPLLAERPSTNQSLSIGPASTFDYGAGAVNATAALDPGLIFDIGFEEYVQFLCTVPGSSEMVKNTTGNVCNSTSGMATDLNLPSITIANLTSSRKIPRKVVNVATTTENYTVSIIEPKGTSVTIQPMQFTIAPNGTQELSVSISPVQSTKTATLGSLVLVGSNGHKVVVPISIVSITKSITQLVDLPLLDSMEYYTTA